VGDADGSHEQKSTFVASPLGLTEPLRTALVCVILAADNVVAEGAGAIIEGIKPILRRTKSSTAFLIVVFMVSNPLQAVPLVSTWVNINFCIFPERFLLPFVYATCSYSPSKKS
jgi:hypothetical protein